MIYPGCPANANAHDPRMDAVPKGTSCAVFVLDLSLRPTPFLLPCYGPARAGVSEIIRQGGWAFAAAAQSGRDFLATLFLVRCPCVKRVAETVRWHPRASDTIRAWG